MFVCCWRCSARKCTHSARAGVGTLSPVRFGGLLAINGLLIYFARNLDNVLIGKVWGTDALGYWPGLFPDVAAEHARHRVLTQA